MAPSKLEEILGDKKMLTPFPELLVGNETRDDAAVYDLGNDKALISTTDFFTPIVDDAFDFGRIAAANAIGDVYAMGGKPILAIAILGWPEEKIPLIEAARVMKGAEMICSLARIPLAGGHSITSQEPFFGLSVNGLISTKNVKRNSTAKPGDLLFLTKPIGTGILSTAMKRSKASEEEIQLVTDSMSTLNTAGEQFGQLAGVHAMTDVTGFGVLGHLIEICEGSKVSAELDFKSLHFLKGVEKYASEFCFPDNTYRNWNMYQHKISENGERKFIQLCDPQTNGGLLVAVEPSIVQEFIRIAKEQGIPESMLKSIGKIIPKQEKSVILID